MCADLLTLALVVYAFTSPPRAVQANNNKHVSLFPSVGHSSCPSSSDNYPGVISAVKREVEVQSRIRNLLCSIASRYHLATCRAHYIEFHALLRPRMHADFPPKTLVKCGIKSENTTPLLIFLSRLSPSKSSLIYGVGVGEFMESF